jgi:hypothetical protein
MFHWIKHHQSQNLLGVDCKKQDILKDTILDNLWNATAFPEKSSERSALDAQFASMSGTPCAEWEGA